MKNNKLKQKQRKIAARKRPSLPMAKRRLHTNAFGFRVADHNDWHEPDVRKD